MSHGTFCFMSFPGYGWYLSSTAALLYCSYFTHNIVAWLKIRPFFTGASASFSPHVSKWVRRIFLGSLALTVPVIIFEIFNNFRFFNNISRMYERVRPYEPLMRDPWWIFSCLTFFHVIRRSYNLDIAGLVRRSPRFGILIASMILAVSFTFMDIISSIVRMSETDGINPYWKLALVFKCLTDNIMLDDFKSVLQRLSAGSKPHDPPMHTLQSHLRSGDHTLHMVATTNADEVRWREFGGISRTSISTHDHRQLHHHETPSRSIMDVLFRRNAPSPSPSASRLPSRHGMTQDANSPARFSTLAAAAAAAASPQPSPTTLHAPPRPRSTSGSGSGNSGDNDDDDRGRSSSDSDLDAFLRRNIRSASGASGLHFHSHSPRSVRRSAGSPSSVHSAGAGSNSAAAASSPSAAAAGGAAASGNAQHHQDVTTTDHDAAAATNDSGASPRSRDSMMARSVGRLGVRIRNLPRLPLGHGHGHVASHTGHAAHVRSPLGRRSGEVPAATTAPAAPAPALSPALRSSDDGRYPLPHAVASSSMSVLSVDSEKRPSVSFSMESRASTLAMAAAPPPPPAPAMAPAPLASSAPAPPAAQPQSQPQPQRPPWESMEFLSTALNMPPGPRP